MTTHIPQIIWQTHEWEYEDLSYDYKMTMLTWKNFNPTWDHRYVSAKERELHIKEYDPALLTYYKRCVGVTQADIWKLCILYLYGGVYSDLDSYCTKSIDEMIVELEIKKDFICIPKMPDGRVMTGTYAAAPQSKVCKEIINDVFMRKLKEADQDNNHIFIGWENMSDEFVKKDKDVDFLFDAVCHSGYYGEHKYSPDFEFYRENTLIKYSDIAKKNNWVF